MNRLLTGRTLTEPNLQVLQNKGASGVDGMEVGALQEYLESNASTYIRQLQEGCYQVSPILGVVIPKPNGKKRLLGISTLVDRVTQQAIAQVLQPIFEAEFQAHSYGFRPGRNAHQAIKQSLQHINKGYQDIVDIDLKSFFGEIRYGLLLELIYRRVQCLRFDAYFFGR